VDEETSRLSVEQPKAGVIVKYFSPVPLSFRQWDGFEPKPDKEFPNQWHVEAGTKQKQKEVGVLTVIVPYRSGQRREWQAERMETDSAVGVRVVRDGKVTLVAFRKGEAKTEAIWAGQAFGGPVLVR
jgi:hypothetical protein